MRIIIQEWFLIWLTQLLLLRCLSRHYDTLTLKRSSRCFCRRCSCSTGCPSLGQSESGTFWVKFVQLSRLLWQRRRRTFPSSCCRWCCCCCCCCLCSMAYNAHTHSQTHVYIYQHYPNKHFRLFGLTCHVPRGWTCAPFLLPLPAPLFWPRGCSISLLLSLTLAHVNPLPAPCCCCFSCCCWCFCFCKISVAFICLLAVGRCSFRLPACSGTLPIPPLSPAYFLCLCPSTCCCFSLLELRVFVYPSA